MLRRLVETACKALKEEDDFLRTKINQNTAFAGQRAGVLRPGFLDERYYQRLVTRQLLAWQPYEALLERSLHDLVLTDRQQGTLWFAVIEMKLWMGSTGNPALAGIIADISKLQHVTSTTHRIMLIFSENPKAQTTANCAFLSDELRQAHILGRPLTPGQNFELDSFLTYSDYPTVKHEDMAFWVAGIEVS
jgi:hypothetical protein